MALPRSTISRSWLSLLRASRTDQGPLRHGFCLAIPPTPAGRWATARADRRRHASTSGVLPSAPSPTRDQSYATEVLELPRHIPSSSGLLLVDKALPTSAWSSHVEMEDEVIAAASDVAKKSGMRVLVRSSPAEQQHHATYIDAEGRATDLGKLSKAYFESQSFRDAIATSGAARPPAPSSILVCTHGARDCRCGDIGGDLVAALRAEVEKRKGTVEIGELGHVGGHKFAATAVLLPSMHMLGNLRPSHAPALLDHLDSLAPGTSAPGDIDTISLEADNVCTTLNISGEGKTDKAAAGRLMWSHYRGAFGKTEEEQEALWAEVTAANAGAEAAPVAPTAAPAQEPYIKPGKSVQLRFVRYSGTPEEEVTEVAGRVGETLMDVAKREGLEPIEGVCGGHLECATCHIYLPEDAPQSDITDDEEDMLGYALEYKEDQSRLACQIKVTEELARWSKDHRGIGLPRF